VHSGFSIAPIPRTGRRRDNESRVRRHEIIVLDEIFRAPERFMRLDMSATGLMNPLAPRDAFADERLELFRNRPWARILQDVAVESVELF